MDGGGGKRRSLHPRFLLLGDAAGEASPSDATHVWLHLRYHDAERTRIITPAEIKKEEIPSLQSTLDPTILDRVQGSIVGMAIGDALGAHVEFRPHSYLVEHPVKDFSAGGTWGLQEGQVNHRSSPHSALSISLFL